MPEGVASGARFPSSCIFFAGALSLLVRARKFLAPNASIAVGEENRYGAAFSAWRQLPPPVSDTFALDISSATNTLRSGGLCSSWQPAADLIPQQRTVTPCRTALRQFSGGRNTSRRVGEPGSRTDEAYSVPRQSARAGLPNRVAAACHAHTAVTSGRGEDRTRSLADGGEGGGLSSILYPSLSRGGRAELAAGRTAMQSARAGGIYIRGRA